MGEGGARVVREVGCVRGNWHFDICISQSGFSGQGTWNLWFHFSNLIIISNCVTYLNCEFCVIPTVRFFTFNIPWLSLFLPWLKFYLPWLRFFLPWLRFFLPWLRFFLPWLGFSYHDWDFPTLTEVFTTPIEVFLLWLRFFLPWLRCTYSDWGFLLPWLKFSYPDWSFSYPYWGFSVLFPQL